MKSDFLLAVKQLAAEKNLPREVILGAVEAALVSAYRKDNFAAHQKITVKIHPATGEVSVRAEKTVVEKPEDPVTEISLEKACAIKPDTKVGDVIMIEATPQNAGRIAAQTAKQVILQRLHEAEHTAVFEEFVGKQSDIITGVVQRIEPKQIFINLGRTEAVLPAAEQVPTERYRMGQRVKAYLLEVARTTKGPRLVVSRSRPGLLQRLFELEIPEIRNGVVEIKGIAREAGFRSKVAVVARQEGVDPIGCCVGLRGIRIQNIVSELSGEKLDIIAWDPNPALFIANSLSPARVSHVTLNTADKTATVITPDKQLSLAIGKEGQNVRLAAKLTGWRIDIKSASEAEAARIAQAKARAEAEAKVAKAAPVAEVAAIEKEPEPLPKVEEEVTVEKEPVAAVAEAKAAEPLLELEEAPVLEEAAAEAVEAEEEVEPVEPVTEALLPVTPQPTGRPVLRFAEDIFGPPVMRGKEKQRRKQRKKAGRIRETEDAKSRRTRQEEVKTRTEDE